MNLKVREEARTRNMYLGVVYACVVFTSMKTRRDQQRHEYEQRGIPRPTWKGISHFAITERKYQTPTTEGGEVYVSSWLRRVWSMVGSLQDRNGMAEESCPLKEAKKQKKGGA